MAKMVAIASKSVFQDRHARPDVPYSTFDGVALVSDRFASHPQSWRVAK